MYLNKRKHGNIIFLFLAAAMLLGFVFPMTALASENLKDMEITIDSQNEYLYEGIMENEKNGPNDLENMLKESDRKNAQGATHNIDMGSISDAVEVNTIKLSLWARKYIVPFTIIIMLFNVFMLSTTGMKNYSKRKRYIYGSIFIYIFFLIVINFPLYLLWRYSLGTEGIFNFEWFYSFVEGLTDFLKEKSFVFSLIILSYGLVNYIGSQNDIPKRMASTFAMKASILMFVLFQIMPLILKMAV